MPDESQVADRSRSQANTAHVRTSGETNRLCTSRFTQGDDLGEAAQGSDALLSQVLAVRGAAVIARGTGAFTTYRR